MQCVWSSGPWMISLGGEREGKKREKPLPIFFLEMILPTIWLLVGGGGGGNNRKSRNQFYLYEDEKGSWGTGGKKRWMEGEKSDRERRRRRRRRGGGEIQACAPQGHEMNFLSTRENFRSAHTDAAGASCL